MIGSTYFTVAAAQFSIFSVLTGPRARRAVVGVLGFALLTALAAQIKFYLPGNPVPVTLQTLAVVGAGLWLAPGLASMSMGLYLALGLIGLPFFADASGGLHIAAGPTFGYLLGFLLAAPVAAKVSRGSDGRLRSWPAVLGACLLAHAAIFALGVPWLKLSTGMDWGWALQNGLVVFLLGTLVKSGLATALAMR